MKVIKAPIGKVRNYVKSVVKRALGKSDMDYVIAPEILNDRFYALIQKLASKEEVKTILEIGSSSGAGSTRAFVEAINARPDRDTVAFYCMELSDVRFKNLKAFTTQYSFAKAFNLSSVPTSVFPSEESVRRFYNDRQTKLNDAHLETVLGWLRQDIAYVKNSGRDVCGVDAIRQAAGLEFFVLCLIDGSEFTGKAELELLMGAKYILLDDTETYKCREAFEMLEADTAYALIEHHPNLRNGCAAFRRI